MNETDDAAIQKLRELVDRLDSAITATEFEAGEQPYIEGERERLAHIAWEIGCHLDSLDEWLAYRLDARTSHKSRQIRATAGKPIHPQNR